MDFYEYFMENMKSFSFSSFTLIFPQSFLYETTIQCEEAKEELQETVEFLRDPEKFQRLGGRMPKGMLVCNISLP